MGPRTIRALAPDRVALIAETADGVPVVRADPAQNERARSREPERSRNGLALLRPPGRAPEWQ
jgi:hypothetical protein